MEVIQFLSQRLLDRQLPGSQGFIPLTWVCRRIFYINPQLVKSQKEGIHNKILILCDAVIRVTYVILIPFALIPAAAGLICNCYVVLTGSLPLKSMTLRLKLDSVFFLHRQVRSNVNLLGLSKRKAISADFVCDQHDTTVSDITSHLHEDKRNHFYEVVASAIELYDCRALTSLDLWNSDGLYPLDSDTLCQETIDWERENWAQDPELLQRIIEAIDDIVAEKKGEIDALRDAIDILQDDIEKGVLDENDLNLCQLGIEANRREIARLEHQCAPYENPTHRVSHYLEQASHPQFRGTPVELYAIAQKYQIGIYVQAVKREFKEDEAHHLIKSDEPAADRDIVLFPEREKQLKLKKINDAYYELLVSPS